MEENQFSKSKVVFVGGHHTTALAVVKKLWEQDRFFKNFDIVWIGHKYSMWGDKNPGAEHCEVTALGIPFYDLKAGKFYRTFDPLKLVRVPLGFLQALYFLLKIRPRLIVSFGGYLAVPVVLVGWLLGIPSVTHEQTVTLGWANRLIGFFAQKIFVSWERSYKNFPNQKTFLVGLPVRDEIISPLSVTSLRKEGYAEVADFLESTIKRRLPLVYFTGGKQGSHLINEVVKESLTPLLNLAMIAHSCGTTSVTDDYRRLLGASRHLPHQDRYLVKPYFSAKEAGAIFAACDLVVGRSGANTTYEIAAIGKPSILIPIPWVSHNEQRENAQVLANEGAAIILPEKELTAESLISNLKHAFENMEEFKRASKKLTQLVRFDAAEALAKEICQYVLKISSAKV